MSRSKKNESFNANSDSDDVHSSGFSRPKSAANKPQLHRNEDKKRQNSNRSDDSLSDRSHEFKSNKEPDAKPRGSFFERITGSVKYSSDSDESVTRTPSLDRSEKSSAKKQESKSVKKEHFSRPHSRQNGRASSHSSASSSSTDDSLASDRPAPKNNQILKISSSRSNSISSEKRKSIEKSNSKNDAKSKNNKKSTEKKRSSSSSSTSSTSSYSKSESNSSVKKNSKNNYSDESDDNYRPSSGHVTKVRVNIEKKPPIDMSKWNKTNRSNSGLEKPNDSMSDSSDTRRSNSIGDTPNKSNHRSSKLNQTFDLEYESSSNEMTDVSPLPTPKTKNEKPRSKNSISNNEKNSQKNSLDMSAFYKILNEDINKRMDSVFSIFNDKYAKGSSKSNLKASFDKDLNTSLDINNNPRYSSKINKIDAENQRLYAKLMNTTQKSLTRAESFNKPIRLTSSALNRQREQQRIEKENQQILKRLLKVKATRYLVKEEQIKDYDKNFGSTSLNYSRTNSSHSMPSGFVSSATSIGAMSNNNSFLSTKRSVKSTANNSRISSAKSGDKSHHHVTNLDTNELLKRAASASRSRPEWIDRW